MLNLTQHSASPAQVEAGVIDMTGEALACLIARLTVDSLPTKREIQDRCADIAQLALDHDVRSVMIGGASWMMSELERALAFHDIAFFYAFSARESVEIRNVDGSVTKTTIFKHEGFV